MIEKLLNKFNYYKAESIEVESVSKKDVEELMRFLSADRRYRRILEDLRRRDKELYFRATNDNDRQLIRGAYDRTGYFLSLLSKPNIVKQPDENL